MKKAQPVFNIELTSSDSEADNRILELQKEIEDRLMNEKTSEKVEGLEVDYG